MERKCTPPDGTSRNTHLLIKTRSKATSELPKPNRKLQAKVKPRASLNLLLPRDFKTQVELPATDKSTKGSLHVPDNVSGIGAQPKWNAPTAPLSQLMEALSSSSSGHETQKPSTAKSSQFQVSNSCKRIKPKKSPTAHTNASEDESVRNARCAQTKSSTQPDASTVQASTVMVVEPFDPQENETSEAVHIEGKQAGTSLQKHSLRTTPTAALLVPNAPKEEEATKSAPTEQSTVRASNISNQKRNTAQDVPASEEDDSATPNSGCGQNTSRRPPSPHRSFEDERPADSLPLPGSAASTPANPRQTSTSAEKVDMKSLIKGTALAVVQRAKALAQQALILPNLSKEEKSRTRKLSTDIDELFLQLKSAKREDPEDRQRALDVYIELLQEMIRHVEKAQESEAIFVEQTTVAGEARDKKAWLDKNVNTEEKKTSSNVSGNVRAVNENIFTLLGAPSASGVDEVETTPWATALTWSVSPSPQPTVSPSGKNSGGHAKHRRSRARSVPRRQDGHDLDELIAELLNMGLRERANEEAFAADTDELTPLHIRTVWSNLCRRFVGFLVICGFGLAIVLTGVLFGYREVPKSEKRNFSSTTKNGGALVQQPSGDNKHSAVKTAPDPRSRSVKDNKTDLLPETLFGDKNETPDTTPEEVLPL
ncbi:uncharacterized protein LOC135399948 [Ornithodoros turicata]|uniref:uncharacterized protein LOC135399948 n=1 Tax=Ornithodoros turicata TaxID=34597 RepID=UPI003138FF26